MFLNLNLCYTICMYSIHVKYSCITSICICMVIDNIPNLNMKSYNAYIQYITVYKLFLNTMEHFKYNTIVNL